MQYLIIGLNFIFIYIFTGSVSPTIGIICTGASIMLFLFGHNNRLGLCIIKWQLSKRSDNVKETEKRLILLSVALVSIAMEISVIITLFIQFGAIVVLTFCIFMATGWWMESNKEVTIGYSWTISKCLVKTLGKIYFFITGIFEMICEWIVKLEFYLLDVISKK